jgi:very-short-patch-repair endonuclease
MGWPGADVQCPAPQVFAYRDAEGRTRAYYPDAWIESLNLIVEVKGEQHAGWRLRDVAIEHLKDAVLRTSGYAYVKVEDKNYGDLVDAMRLAALAAEGA